MTGLDIIIILVIGFIFYKLVLGREPHENFDNSEWDYNIDADLDKLFKKKNNDHAKSKESEKDHSIKPFYVEMQFHSDYRDTVTAFNNIAPSQKQIFNKSNLPVTVSQANEKEVRRLIRDFITAINNSVKNTVDDTVDPNSGWDEYQPERRMRSGWEKQQKALGLPTSLYNEPAKRARVKLISIEKTEKYETDNELEYVCYLIIQKRHVHDQMVLRVSFAMDKQSINTDRELLKGEKIDYDTNVMIEEIFIMGYMTDHSYGAKSKPDDFYNFKALETNDNIVNQKALIKELNKKYKQRQQDTNGLTAILNEPNKYFHDELPTLHQAESNAQALNNITVRPSFP